MELTETQAQRQAMAIAMGIRDDVVAVCRRYGVHMLATLTLAAVIFAGWMYTQRRHDAVLSAEFRSSAQQAYSAIVRCENYKLTAGDSYQLRELDAEKAVAGASAIARTHADLLAAMALSDYLHEVKVVHLAWQNRDRKSGKHYYAESSRELKTAKQKVHTFIKLS